MWCPEGYYSWNQVFNELQTTADVTLALACLGGKPNSTVDGKEALVHSTEFYLEKCGYADTREEAELILAITTVYLMVHFLEAFPPILASIEGNKISADFSLLCHKDQLENCHFDWPMKESAPFAAFFEYAKLSGFQSDDLLGRFAFINAYTGLISPKNGSVHYVQNGLGYGSSVAKKVLDTAIRLKDYLVCWSSFPEAKDYRSFLQCLEVDEVFTQALNYAYGALPTEKIAENLAQATGRPRKRDELARCYIGIFPDGHAAEGVPWKVAIKAVEKVVGGRVTKATLARGIREMRRFGEQK